VDDIYKKLVDNLPCPIIIHDKDKILSANKAVSSLLGYEEKKDLRNLKSLAYVIGTCSNSTKAHYYKNNGATIELEQKSIPIKQNDKEINVLILKDPSESNWADVSKEIKQSESDNTKNRFLAAVSHEMRTPLNALINLSHMLKGTDLNQEQISILNVAQNSAQELLDRIEDLLEYSQLEKERIIPTLEPVNIANVVEPVFEILVQEANLKGVEFVINISNEANQEFMANSSSIRRIVRHICENAIKYSQSGMIKVDICVGEGGEGIILSVADNGIGISQEKLTRIFEPFVFDIDPINRDKGGLSLGLALTRAIIRNLGGELSITSNQPNGTIVNAYLPLKLALNDDADFEEDFDPSLNILVAEDNRTNQKVVRLILGQLGHEITTADDGLLCIETLGTQKFDLILMDLHMPNMDGYEAARQIRSTGNEIPIFALTADARVEARHLAIDAGMDGFLTKPLVVSELHNMLSEVAHLKQLQLFQKKCA
jgi:two-component system, sensor histidine kinase and response regulator